jgi:hypothetical protein
MEQILDSPDFTFRVHLMVNGALAAMGVFRHNVRPLLTSARARCQRKPKSWPWERSIDSESDEVGLRVQMQYRIHSRCSDYLVPGKVLALRQS